MEEAIGQITHFFPKINVAIVALTKELKVGDSIKIKGKKTDFSQTVDSLQKEHQAINEAGAGLEVGMKIVSLVQEGDVVYKIT